MRVAICFYGLVGGVVGKNGKGQNLDPSTAYKLNADNIINPNNADIFIHSWSTEEREILLDLYQPKDSVIEPQMEFQISERIYRNISFKEKIRIYFNRFSRPSEFKNSIIERDFSAKRAYSRWYSSKKVLSLK